MQPDQNGGYLDNCKVDMDAVEPYAMDRDDAEKLWNLSEEMVGEKFEY